MPFPWKKAKGSRFSQLVADHLHSPKRGSSLVVETGFPTSLVDLFVKNRNRMKESHKKNRSSVGDCDSPPLNRPKSNYLSDSPTRPANHCTIVEGIVERDNSIPIVSSAGIGGGGRPETTAATILPIDEEIAERDTPISIGSSVGVGGGGGLPIRSATNYPTDGEIDERDNPIPIVSSGNVGGGGVDGLAETGLVGLLMSLLKIFVVVGLALGTKRFVIGITVSAFVLFFLELVGKRLYRNQRFRVSSDEHSKLKSVIQRAPCFDVIKPNDQLSIGGGEIQIVKIKSNLEQISSSGESFDAGNCNERFVCEQDKKKDLEKEEEQRCKVPGLEHRHSRRAKMKSKLKKLVPKKLRKSKKICLNPKSEVCSLLQDDTCEEQEELNIVELNCQEEQALSMEFHGDGHARESLTEEHQALSTESHGDELAKESSTRELEEIVVVEQLGRPKIAVVEQMRRPSQRGSGYLVLCLIVLFGLVGGRMVALVLALSWFSILKILTRRSS